MQITVANFYVFLVHVHGPESSIDYSQLNDLNPTSNLVFETS